MLCLRTNLAICQSSTLLPFYPRGRSWAYLHPRTSCFWDTGHFSKLPYLSMKLGHWPKFQSCTYTVFLPQGGEMELVFALRAAVSEIGPIFKIAVFEHETWPLANVPEVCTYTLFLPQGVEIYLIFTIRAAVSEIWADFQNCHIWAWNLAIGQSARSCTYILHLPQGGRNWAYFCSMGSGFRETDHSSKLPY